MENPDKFVPISNVTLNVNGTTNKQWTFNPTTGTIILGESDISVSVTSAPNSSNYGYGYGYGVDTIGYGYSYNFGYGYGYGYGYGQGGGSVNFIYQITLSTANLAAGSYTATAYLNTGNQAKPNFASSSASFTVSAAAPPGPSGDGAGTGGGGIVTSEPYANIEKAERYDKSLIANTPVTYTFKAPELGIYEIAVTGKESENDIALRVEVLKGTSKLVTLAPPGIVYKNVNIWAGTKRIKEVLIRFKVENSWLTSNNFAGSDVKLVKWDGSKWVQLETSEKTKDASFTYFETKTDTFSVFAITGLKGGVIVPTATPAGAVTETPAKPTVTAATPAPTPTEKVPGFELVLVVAALCSVYLFSRKRG